MKRKRTKEEKEQKRKNRIKYMYIFVNGKQKRVLRPPTIDGIPEDEFLEQNANDIYWHLEEQWENISGK